MSKLAWRYVELTYELPGAEREQWRAAVIQASSPDKPLECAKADAVVAHPDATYLRRGESINMKVGREPRTTMPDIARIA